MPLPSASNKILEIAFVCDLAAEPIRGILRGFTRYARQHCTWNITLVAKMTNEANPSSLAHWQGDGMIAHATSREIYHAALSKKCPVILLSRADFERNADTSPEKGSNYVSCDNRAVIETAIRYFDSEKHTRFAYVPCAKSVYWCLERQKCFERQFTANPSMKHFVFPRTDQSDWYVERDRMCDWLRSLPKPIAVLAANDMRGRQVLEACQLAGISVPGEVSVLGVNNDIPICEMSYPTLSSIAIDWEKAGFMSAEVLDNLIRGSVMSERHYGPTEVVTRQSTESLHVSDPMVFEILETIHKDKGESLRVSDILRSVSVSERRAQERFKAVVGHSIKEELQRVRMKNICKLIEETNLSFQEIARHFGFEDATHLGKAFKKQFEMTMGEYRKLKNETAPLVFYRPED